MPNTAFPTWTPTPPNNAPPAPSPNPFPTHTIKGDPMPPMQRPTKPNGSPPSRKG